VSRDGDARLRIVVVDDHPIWRSALVRDLESAGQSVVGEADTVSKAINVVNATRPDVVLLDLQLPDGSGVDVIRAIPEGTHVLVLSASGEQDDVLAAVKAGATGYLTKSASAVELLDAVTRTSLGEAVFTPALAGLMLGEYRRLAIGGEPKKPVLTERETEVLRLVAKGLSSRQIAERLVVSHRTVENHVQATLRKLQLHNRVELARYAMRQGLEDTAGTDDTDDVDHANPADRARR
jgi:DNA-binding NarL/FixJ family response regulator